MSAVIGFLTTTAVSRPIAAMVCLFVLTLFGSMLVCLLIMKGVASISDWVRWRKDGEETDQRDQW